MTTNDWAPWFADHQKEHLAELFEFLRIPSVSALPDHAGDIRAAADWVAKRMQVAGVPDVQVLDTGGHPLVFGKWHVSDDLPTAMFYAHYDVQPPDPLELWESAPFEPEIRDGKIFARGAGDDKAGLLITLLATEALARRNGTPPINLLFFFEGEEEIGSPNVSPFVAAHPELLACDFVISADGMQWGEEIPSLLVSTKGMAGCQIDLETASVDMHSGTYGASVRNAAQAIAELVATFHDERGRVAIDGFYDGVADPTPEERAETAAVPIDEAAYFGEVGAGELWGEEEFTPLERLWFRPTLDINGLWSGFQGDGTKTVTPAEAHAKITCRLVPGQDPKRILQLIERHAREHCPAGAEISLQQTAGSALAYGIPRDHFALLAAGETLAETYGRAPVISRTGGTIPIAEVFTSTLGAEMVFFAWSLENCNAHAPNEWFRLKDFSRGATATCAYLERLAGSAS